MKFGWTAPFGKFGGGGGKKPASQQDIIWRGRNGVESGTDNVVNDTVGTLSDANYVGNNALSFDGTSSQYILDDDIVGTETVSVSDGTCTVSVSAGRLDFTAGVISYIELSNGIKYALCQTSGSDAWRIETKNTINFSETVDFSETLDFYS